MKNQLLSDLQAQIAQLKQQLKDLRQKIRDIDEEDDTLEDSKSRTHLALNTVNDKIAQRDRMKQAKAREIEQIKNEKDKLQK